MVVIIAVVVVITGVVVSLGDVLVGGTVVVVVEGTTVEVTPGVDCLTIVEEGMTVGVVDVEVLTTGVVVSSV